MSLGWPFHYGRFFPRGQLLFFVITGLAEGILTAMILAAGRILEPSGAATAGLAVRVGLVAGLPEAVVFFAAEYSRQQGDLARMERQLNLPPRRQLAAGRLGRQALEQSLSAACVASACSFVGAAVPLVLASVIPGSGWVSLLAAATCLALLGYGIAYTLSGCRVCWALVLALAGGVLSVLGVYLKVL